MSLCYICRAEFLRLTTHNTLVRPHANCDSVVSLVRNPAVAASHESELFPPVLRELVELLDQHRHHGCH